MDGKFNDHRAKVIRGFKMIVRKMKKNWRENRKLAETYSVIAAIVHQHLTELGVDAKKILDKEVPKL